MSVLLSLRQEEKWKKKQKYELIPKIYSFQNLAFSYELDPQLDPNDDLSKAFFFVWPWPNLNPPSEFMK